MQDMRARIRIDNHHWPAEKDSHRLYIMRSGFVHQARLIREFNDG